MRRKLRRTGNVFGKRGMPPALKAILWIVACVAVVALGYFGAMLLSEGGLPQPDVQVDTNTPGTTDQPTTNSTTHNNQEPTQPSDTPAASFDGIRAFYLPSDALSPDTLSETATLSEAAAAGFNAVVFDLKDADGTMYYQFSANQAKKVNNFAPNALTADNLKTLFAMMRECGLQPIPRLYAFCDDPAAKVLSDARIALESNHSWSWYDGDPNNGGKKWLNPYAPAAQDYISALVNELKAQGAAAVLLDGVQFPSQLSSAYLGEEAATVSKGDALAAFVGRIRTELGDDCPLLLACTEKGALGTDTKVYGGNPLTFGPAMASPMLTAKYQESVEKMILRTQVLEEKPTLAPMLKTVGLTAEQVSDAISACIKGGAKDFILFDHEGYYEFAAYDLP